MKNPFKKQNNTALIALGVTGAAAAGAIAYLYLTDSGNNTRNKISDSVSETIDKISHSLKDEFKNIASAFISKKAGVSKRTVKAVADHVSK
ncbi:MAG TPA: YtxH domain-containing protein [Mucilaginibacter sp.]|jgi:gas vesicle protein